MAPREVVSVDGLDHTVEELRNELFALREKNAKLRAFLRLFVALLRVSGFSLSQSHLPEGSRKRAILRAVASACHTLQMRVVLRVLRLSPRRYHTWKIAEKVHFRAGDNIPDQLEEVRATARHERLAWNRQASCEACDPQLASVAG